MLVFDTEIYKNYFLISFMEVSTGKIKHFEMFDDHPLDRKSVHSIFKNYTTVGFNSTSFDMPIVYGALVGYDNAKLKELCDDIIGKSKPRWMTERDWGMEIPKAWNHIDIIEVAPGSASLKIYGGRLNAPKMQDLPIEPDAVLTREQMIQIRNYCENDLRTTAMLYNKLIPQIELREKMSAQYSMDLRSKSDAQIAETVILSELEKLTGKKYRREEVADNVTFRYKNPQIVSFKRDDLKDTFTKILRTQFTLGGNGSVQMPEWLKDHKIRIGSTTYQMGIGGLHSCEKSQYVSVNDDELLLEVDCASYYPNIILHQSLAPKSMGREFLKVYQGLVKQRLKSKKLQVILKDRIATLERELKDVIAKKKIS